jgi:hypothetical protein
LDTPGLNTRAVETKQVENKLLNEMLFIRRLPITFYINGETIAQNQNKGLNQALYGTAPI